MNQNTKPRILILITQLLDDGPNKVIQGILSHFDLDKWHITVGYLYGNKDHESMYHEIGIPTYCFNMKGFLNAWIDFTVVKRISEFLISENIQLLHTHLVRSDIFGRLAAKKSGTPVISTIHNMEDHHRGKKLHEYIVRFLDKKTIVYTNRIVTVSESLKTFIHELYNIPMDKVSCIHNGIDFPDCEKFFLKKSDLGIENNTPLIGTVARLHPQKGIDILIDSVAILLNKGIDIKALIVGDGPIKEKLFNYVNQKGIKNNIVFTGFRKDVCQYLALMDIFVLPSRWEGFGISAVESMAMGIPVVASNVGGISEIVDNGITGFLINPDEPQAFSNAIYKLLENPLRRKKFGEAGKNRYNASFRASTMSKCYQDLYSNLIK